MKINSKDRFNIKEQHYWTIHNFVYYNDRTRLQGRKLEALYRLIQWKGKPLDFPPDHKFNGIKVIEYADSDFIGFIRTGFSKRAFFPCKLQTVALRVLGTIGESKPMAQ